MEAKFKLNEELLVSKGEGNVLATIIGRKLIKDLDTSKTEIKYIYSIPNQTLAETIDEEMLVLFNQLALEYEKIEMEKLND